MKSRVPYERLSALARHEAHRKSLHRPPYYLHKWWARRTGTVVRGMLLDLLLPPDSDVMGSFYRAHDFSDITILDPFMGGGTTLGEGLRLGCRVVGCDVNPVAWFLVRRSLDELDVEALDEAFAEVEAAVAKPISALYKTTCSQCDGPATIQGVAWVKQIDCRACGELVDLNLDQVVMRSFDEKKLPNLVDCPECGHVFRSKRIDRKLACPECEHRFIPKEKRCVNTDYLCACGHQETIIGERRKLARPLAYRMRTITAWCDSCGRIHQAPTDADLRRYARIERDVDGRWRSLLIPRQRIPAGRNTDQLLRYGYHYWNQLFNARQLAALDLLFRAIDKVQDEKARETLLLLASASLEFNSMLCSAKGIGTGAIRQVFTHHAFIPAKCPFEANVWGAKSSSGGLATLYRHRVPRAATWAQNPVEPRPRKNGKTEKVPVKGERLAGKLASSFAELEQGDANLLVLNQSSERLEQIPDGSIDLIATDPPYADMVMYSELADFFYVWLRLLLKDKYPASFEPALVDDSREAVHNVDRNRDGDFYAALVGDVLGEAGRKLKQGGRLAFSFHHAGDHGWRYIEDALIRGGFVVERWWPVFAEMESGVHLLGKDNGGHLDIVFVCGKAGEVKKMIRAKPAAELGAKLAKHLTLVPADYRALLKASEVQRATWARASQAVARGIGTIGPASRASTRKRHGRVKISVSRFRWKRGQNRRTVRAFARSRS
jgi:putative DNA methylase